MSKITLNNLEKEQLRNNLYHNLMTLSEYHYELEPHGNDCLEELICKYCYWGKKYNDKHIPEKEYNDKLSVYLVQKLEEYCHEGTVTPVSDLEIDDTGKAFIIYTTYAEDTDITFIMKDVYKSEDEVSSTECIGWYYGTEDEELTIMNSGKLKAIF